MVTSLPPRKLPSLLLFGTEGPENWEKYGVAEMMHKKLHACAKEYGISANSLSMSLFWSVRRKDDQFLQGL